MKGRVVLVIEDNPLNMKLARRLLQMSQCEVVEAENAEQGIELAKRRRPDLILMDIQLPGMDGYAATRIIKQDAALKEIPVVALTAHAMAGDEKRALESGCTAYLMKPIDTRAFPALLETWLSKDEGPEERGNGVREKSLVLIVDDNPTDLKILRAKLPSEQYEVCTASKGIDALQMVVSHPPDVILLDVVMPEMDGYEVTKKLKRDSRTRDIPIILVTSLDRTEDRIKGLEAGADEFLNKPVNATELLSRIRSLLALKHYTEQLTHHRRLENMFLTPSPSRKAGRSPEEASTVLLVEDSPLDANLIESYIDGMTLHLERAGSAEEALSLLSRRKLDVVLLDILLPGMDGYTFCQILKEKDRNIQVLVVTCLKDLESRIKGLEHGADDFLVKPIRREELRIRVNGALKRKAYLDRLSSGPGPELSDAITDKQTGLYTPSYFKHFLELELKRVNRQGRSLSLVLMEIDPLKGPSGTGGQSPKDEILKDVGNVIGRSIRSIDLAARYAEEKFAIVLPYTSCREAEQVAERIRKGIASSVGGPPHHRTVRLGIVGSSLGTENVESLIDEGRRALSSAH